MIKNLVFDLGNVLISFKPSEYFEKNNYPENIKSRILSDIFASEEWLILDKGEINTQQAIDSIASKSSLKREEIEYIFNLRYELLFPIDTNVRLLPDYKKRGFKLYFLSNLPIDLYEAFKNDYYFFRYFDGGVISAEAKVSKPDEQIYKILLGKYNLKPEECLFIDDLEVNVRAAKLLGIKGLITFGSQEISEMVETAIKKHG